MITEQVSESIYTGYFSSPAGLLHVKSTQAFITEVSFLDEDKGAGAFLPDSFPQVLSQCIQELAEYFEGQRKTFSVPMQQKGTPFQQAVWKELMSIPFGATISYLELSKRLGNVKAIRAAAASNGKNKIAVIVPCHRVIGSNREMVGYAAGISRKRWLLQHEAAFSHGLQTLFS